MSVFEDEKYLNLGGNNVELEYSELTDDTIYLIQKIQAKYENIAEDLKTTLYKEKKGKKDNNTFYIILIGIAFYVGTKY